MKWYVGGKDGFGKWLLISRKYVQQSDTSSTKRGKRPDWTDRLSEAAEFVSIADAHNVQSLVMSNLGEHWQMGNNTLMGSAGFQDIRSIPDNEIMNYLIAQELTG